MFRSRREFLAGAAGTAAAVGMGPLALPTVAEAKEQTSPPAILSLFKSLPGEVAVKIHAPATNGKPEFLVESNSSKQMFAGSAIKTFILCEALRQADSPQVVKTLAAEQLALDASVWSVDSATFNPPNLIGKVSERTALEAMILHSDNTGHGHVLEVRWPRQGARIRRFGGIEKRHDSRKHPRVFWLSSRREGLQDLLVGTNLRSRQSVDCQFAHEPSRVSSGLGRRFRVLLFAGLAGRILREQRDPE